ncbi:Nucleosome assembly protein [Zancudomyces culisetae]|uniref:Nucleosome assembly protein n=1 Tax=Zancudomyces culisetae TaxID=1213189 RepID=A0A1R1PHW4_ZANCU|nr:Nucleosome assembly protein [Zancudomyces culisetae]|eukprot:OMH80538.1 Nucleosome assembly protein [Zancudomyces culisetae]
MDQKPINIQKKEQDDLAPTPQNTPIFKTQVGGSKPAAGNPAMELMNNPAITGLVQGRLQGLAGAPSEYIESLPKEVKARLAGLQALQEKHIEIEAGFHKEILELEKKYAKLYDPLYERRARIIKGDEEPTTEEVKRGKELLRGDDEESKIEEVEEEGETDPEKKVKGIDSFWLTVLYNHPQTQEMITERDAKALAYLQDIKVEYSTEEPGFKVVFKFDENNTYFNNTELVKSYSYAQSKISGDLVFEKSESTKIDWKPNMDLTTTVETKKQRHKTTNKTRVVKKTVPAESFFNFFETIPLPDEKDDSEEAEEARERLEADYELGEELKEKIVPNAIDWFTGKALEYEDYGEEEYDEGMYDDEYSDEDEDDDEDEDEDEDEEGHPKAPVGKDGEAPQCKQQ